MTKQQINTKRGDVSVTVKNLDVSSLSSFFFLMQLLPKWEVPKFHERCWLNVAEYVPTPLPCPNFLWVFLRSARGYFVKIIHFFLSFFPSFCLSFFLSTQVVVTGKLIIWWPIHGEDWLLRPIFILSHPFVSQCNPPTCIQSISSYMGVCVRER